MPRVALKLALHHYSKPKVVFEFVLNIVSSYENTYFSLCYSTSTPKYKQNKYKIKYPHEKNYQT